MPGNICYTQYTLEVGMLNSFFFQIRISTSKIRIKFELRLYISGEA